MKRLFTITTLTILLISGVWNTICADTGNTRSGLQTTQATIPWAVNFESDTIGALPSGWEQAGGRNYVYVSDQGWISGKKLIIYSDGGYTYAILPAFDSAQINNSQIEFRHIEESATYSGGLELGYYLNGSFKRIKQFDVSTSWKMQDPYPLIGIPSAAAKIAFAYQAKLTDYKAAIDSIHIATISSCDSVTELYVAWVTHSSAKITWNSQAYNFKVRYKKTSSSVWDTVPCNAREYTFTNLLTDTTYQVQVQVLCNSSHVSNWSDSITFAPKCTTPTGLVAKNITQVSADIVWQSSESDFKLIYKADSAAKWDTIACSTTHCTLNKLSLDTKYQVLVQTTCIDTVWSDTLTFNTKKIAMVYLNESFGATLPDGWSNSEYDDYGGNQWEVDQEGDNYFVSHKANKWEMEPAAIRTPDIYLQKATYPVLMFDWKSDSIQSINLTRSINSGARNDISKRLNEELSMSSNNKWITKAILLDTSYVGKTVRLTFLARSKTSQAPDAVVALDNVLVAELSDSVLLRNMRLHVTPTKDGADITWNTSVLQEKAWLLRYKDSTDTEWINIADTLKHNSYQLADLHDTIKYEVQVQPVDTIVTKNGIWTAPVTFKPLGTPTTIQQAATSHAATKIILGGQLLIIRDDKTYTIHGQRIE